MTLKLFKGTASVHRGREREHALYDERFVTFGEDDVYQQSDARWVHPALWIVGAGRAIRDHEMAAAKRESEAKVESLESAALAIA